MVCTDRTGTEKSASSWMIGAFPVCSRVQWTYSLGHELHAHPLLAGTGNFPRLDTSLPPSMTGKK